MLSSIDSPSTPVQIPQVTRKPPVKKPEDAPLGTSTKRKAEDDLSRSVEKVSKVIVPQPRKLAPENGTKPMVPSQSAKTKPTSDSSLQKRIDNLGPNSASSKAPKKGSFADIMARGQQKQPTQIGTINHKPKEKLLGKKDLAVEKELAKKKGLKGQVPKVGNMTQGNDITQKKPMNNGKGGDKSVKPAGYQGTGKPASKAPNPPGYSGTAKPKPQSGYQGTMKGSGGAAVRNKPYYSDSDQPRPKNAPASRGRARDDYDEPDEYESDDHYNYNSEDYSDMDAGFDDMEEENLMAERIAKREDAAEQAELDRLKRDKDRKKATLGGGKGKR